MSDDIHALIDNTVERIARQRDAQGAGVVWYPLSMEETPEQRAKRLGVPLVANDPLSKGSGTEPVLAVCGTCGSELRKSNVGQCTRVDCPTKLRK